ncbi:MAG: hypothetical protein RPR40_11390, partial [Bermanella sp.]
MPKYLLIMLLCITSLHAESQSEYEAYLQQNTLNIKAERQAFQDYLNANDKAFIGFLKQQWQK